MDDEISWLSGWTSQWSPPQGLSEQIHCDNAATTVIRTARTLEAVWLASLRGSVGTGDKER